jgi:hypothetical protein
MIDLGLKMSFIYLTLFNKLRFILNELSPICFIVKQRK